MLLSIVVPVYNEEDNIKPMVEKISGALENIEHEILLVDDGSSDNTANAIQNFPEPHIRLIQLSRNFGQTSAMAAGIEKANGQFIATIDGDLQNDPADIPIMLERLQKDNLDIIAGIRMNRQDGLYLRKVPSKIANWIIRKTTNVHLSDYGCTLKLFRASIAKKIDLYGELHRFIPILASMEGAKIAEIPVRHHARQFGTSKYGIGRTFRVISDLMLMLFFMKYRQKPMHLFGTLGSIMLIIGSIIEFYLLTLKILGNDIGGRPLFYVGILLLITGVQLITTGFISEMLMRTYYKSQNKKPYNIKEE